MVETSSFTVLMLMLGSTYFVDKIPGGFLAWAPDVKVYTLPPIDKPAISWEDGSQASLAAVLQVVNGDDFFNQIALLWGQESNKKSGDVELRNDNVTFIRSLGARNNVLATL